MHGGTHHSIRGNHHLESAGQQALVEGLVVQQRGEVALASPRLLRFEHVLQHPVVQLDALQAERAPLSSPHLGQTQPCNSLAKRLCRLTGSNDGP